MSEQVKYHRSTGMDYYYFILRTIFGMVIFYVWTRSINLFVSSGLDLFWTLFLVMFFSGIMARVLSYILLFFLSKKGRGIMPGFYQINFQRGINRISAVFIMGTLLCCLIYSFGIDQYIVKYLFPEDYGLWSILFSYLFIKLGSQAIAWIFLKTKV